MVLEVIKVVCLFLLMLLIIRIIMEIIHKVTRPVYQAIGLAIVDLFKRIQKRIKTHKGSS